MGALERAQRDLTDGRHWLARQRLESYLESRGYNAEVLATLGWIAWEMHDAYNAGRYWLVSAAAGEEVERAIITFATQCGSDPRRMALGLPRAARLQRRGDYPSLVRERFAGVNLLETIERLSAPKTSSSARAPSSHPVITFLFIVIALASLGSCIVGAHGIVSWIRGEP